MTDRFRDIARLQRIADYQFGRDAGMALFGDVERITRTKSGRPNQLIGMDGRLATFGLDGRFTLGIAGGRRLFRSLPNPAYRVVVGEESEPFICDGKNAFAKFVQQVDPVIRAEDEVLVVRILDPSPERVNPPTNIIENDLPSGKIERLLAVGRAELDAQAMLDFETGMAVSIRESVRN